MSSSKSGPMNIPIVMKLSTQILSQQSLSFCWRYPAHPMSLPTDLATILNLPFVCPYSVPLMVGTSHFSWFPLHRPGSPGSLLNCTQTLSVSLITTLTRRFSPGALVWCYTRKQDSCYPCCLLFLYCSLVFASLRKPRCHHRTLKDLALLSHAHHIRILPLKINGSLNYCLPRMSLSI